MMYVMYMALAGNITNCPEVDSNITGSDSEPVCLRRDFVLKYEHCYSSQTLYLQ